MIQLFTAILIVALAGCAADRGTVDRNAPGAGVPATAVVHGSKLIASAPARGPHAAPPAIPVVVSLDVYHLTVPSGAVSSNEDFWKRVDEQRLDVATYDLLLKNGVRAGIGHDADWPWFKGLLGHYPSARSSRGRTRPNREGYVELDMRTNVPSQNVFWLNDHGEQCARTFEKCSDLLGISFVASAHQTGQVIVKVCPIVRSVHRYFPVTILNNDEPDVEMTSPEHLFNLRLEAAIPINDFLIVAPSKEAKWPTSLGATFLTSDGKAEPLEEVLLIVPRLFRTDEPQPKAAGVAHH